MTTAEKIKETIAGIFFILGFFGLICATAIVEPVEEYIIETRGE